MSMDALLVKQVFKNKEYESVIDTEFKELLKTEQLKTEQPQISIPDFFKIYEEIFFKIQKKGDELSHEYLIKKSTQYVGENKGPLYAAMQEEITSLKKELLGSYSTIEELTQQLKIIGESINNG